MWRGWGKPQRGLRQARCETRLSIRTSDQGLCISTITQKTDRAVVTSIQQSGGKKYSTTWGASAAQPFLPGQSLGKLVVCADTPLGHCLVQNYWDLASGLGYRGCENSCSSGELCSLFCLQLGRGGMFGPPKEGSLRSTPPVLLVLLIFLGTRWGGIKKGIKRTGPPMRLFSSNEWGGARIRAVAWRLLTLFNLPH